MMRPDFFVELELKRVFWVDFSSESLDRVGRRDSYLKSTFESLGESTRDADGANGAASLDMTVVSAQPSADAINSLSAKFLGVGVAAALTKAAPRDAEAARKREELQRRIEETRRKLQSVRPFLASSFPFFVSSFRRILPWSSSTRRT